MLPRSTKHQHQSLRTAPGALYVIIGRSSTVVVGCGKGGQEKAAKSQARAVPGCAAPLPTHIRRLHVICDEHHRAFIGLGE